MVVGGRDRRMDMNQEQDDIRILWEAGFVGIAKQYRAMASALRVIHTWAKGDTKTYGGLLTDPRDVIKLTERALRRFK
jgi:hypothetical protein